MRKLAIQLVYRDPDSEDSTSTYLYLRRFERVGPVCGRPDFLTTADLDKAYLFNDSKRGKKKALRRIETILHEIGDFGLADASVVEVE